MERDREELAQDRRAHTIRPYLTTDLLWLEDIARKYDEWPDLLQSLTMGVAAFVIAPLAIGVVFFDEHGLRLGALAEEKGIKPLVKICHMMVDGAKATDTILHGHWQKDSWQAKFAEKYGFVLNGHGYHVMREGG